MRAAAADAVQLLANVTYFMPQVFEHGRPIPVDNIVGRHGQTFAQPRVVMNAVGGRKIEVHFSKFDVVQDACYNATCAHGRQAVHNLHTTRQRQQHFDNKQQTH